MRVIISLFFVLNFNSFAFGAKNSCSFIKHQYLEIIGDKTPNDLKNKILNNINEDKEYVLKENPVLGAKICTVLHPLKHIKDLPVESIKPGEEHLLVKAELNEDKKFWKLKISSFIQTNSKGLTPVSTSEDFTSSKSIQDIKDVEVVDWIIGKLVQPIKK